MIYSLLLFLLSPEVSVYAKFEVREAPVNMHKGDHASHRNLRINLMNCYVNEDLLDTST